MDVIQTKVLEKPEKWANREGGMSLNLSPASRPSYAECLTMVGQKLEGPKSLHASDAQPRG